MMYKEKCKDCGFVWSDESDYCPNCASENTDEFHLRECQCKECVTVAIESFLKEIIKVCKKYNFSISHEECYGAFIIEEYDEDNIKWLMGAEDGL